MIESYSFGRIVVDGKVYRNDILLFDDEVQEWWRKRGHELRVGDLAWIVSKRPSVLIIGTGSYGVLKVPEEVKEKLRSLDIELRVKKTKEACDLYNSLEGRRKIAAGLHLTC